MRTFNQWMDEYNVSHMHPTNQLLHKICVPLILLTVIGFLWCAPVPQFFTNIPFLNWATLFVVSCLCFYLTLNFMMFLGMMIQMSIMCLISHWLFQAGFLLEFCIVVFTVSWIGQFWGHKIEGKKPSFMQDLAFLLIGPLWVQRYFYKMIGLNV